ncbi:MAG: hybrid sensor histidine kinase/response regulator [Betaproteobacteria bacterium]|nr:hybrid sensor histidine kinase/response regulator [Betaproteobacteria bacterium]
MNNQAQEEAARAKRALEGTEITQLREANENLVIATVHAQTLTEASERASRQKEEFLAMLAHELRNPLAPIVNALAVLRRVATAEPLVPWAHDVIKRQVDHMTRLLDDLLDVSRVTTGKIALQKRATTVSEVMLQAVETSRPPLEARNQYLTVVIPPKPLTVDGDPARLVQVFSNLLNNAAKYTQEGGAITFSAKQRGDAVVLRVTDDGFGIAAEALPGIFDLFTQEDRSLARAEGGLGIGLTVVRAIVEMHGGAVTAASPGPGEGSEFEVTLPLLQTPPSPPIHTMDVEPTSPDLRYRIALIEDNIDVNASLKTLLQLMGHEVATAFDGVSGVRLVQADRPQIVLCDIGLPGLDGYGVIARLREELAPPLPVMIALTGYGLPEDRARALTAGFDHHLVKPVNPDDLLRVITAECARISKMRS